MNNLIKEIEFTPAWDKRSNIPNQNYGIHGVDLIFTVKNEQGTVWFKLSTMWHWLKDIRDFKPFPTDLGYHSPKPMYEGHTQVSENCKYTEGICYYDGSGLNAETPWNILLHKGSDGVWEFLEKYHSHIFNGTDYPIDK